ncbi:MAG: hypothetical protein VKJ02_16955 [Snowella sp.]|nr:hypothetical protein [Snowella sp.]
MHSKYEELCQLYAQARQASLQSIEVCQLFAELFIVGMENYFQCSIEIPNYSFDEQGSMHFYPAIALYADPLQPEEAQSELVVISISLEKYEDCYGLTLFPWEESFQVVESQKETFIPVYDFIFEKIKESYANSMIAVNHHTNRAIRNLGWDS